MDNLPQKLIELFAERYITAALIIAESRGVIPEKQFTKDSLPDVEKERAYQECGKFLSCCKGYLNGACINDLAKWLAFSQAYEQKRELIYCKPIQYAAFQRAFTVVRKSQIEFSTELQLPVFLP